MAENDLSMFDDLLSDDGATGMEDPITGESFNPLDNEPSYRNDEPVRNTEKTEGFIEKPYNIMSDDDEPEPTYEDSIINDVLRSKGFNPNAIKIQDEDTGEFKTEKFADLSKQEQMSILNYNEQEAEIEDDEIDTLNFLRQNNININDFADIIRRQTLQELERQNQPNYTVDDFNDDELFIIDFKNKYGDDVSDDEVIYQLNQAKMNGDLFNRQMSRVRDQFREAEYEQQAYEAQMQMQQIQQAHQDYIDSVVYVAENMNSMHNMIDMDDNDKNDVLDYMFEPTGTGETEFERALKDPEMRYKAAWYLRNGDAVFSSLDRYYKQEITRLSRQNQKPQTVIKDTKTRTTTRRPRTLDDLF